MKKHSLKFYSRISAIIIWLILIGLSIYNLNNCISIILIFIPIPIILINNLLVFGDLNIFKDGLDRSILFLEKRLTEIKNIK
jgi:hypothetical protein